MALTMQLKCVASSQNSSGCKGPFEILLFNPLEWAQLQQSPLKQADRDHAQLGSEYVHRWRPNSLSGKTETFKLMF